MGRTDLMLRVIVLICFIAAPLALSNCNSEGEEPEETPAPEPGFGISEEDPTGTPFVFPSGVSVEGNKVHTPDFCLTPDSLISLLVAESRETIKGAPGYFTVCITLNNSNPFQVMVTCPAGMTYICERDERNRPRAQNGITITDVTYTLKPKSTETFLLDLYCLNSDRTRPGMEISFALGPVTENPGMKKLISLLRDKNVHNDELGTEWIDVLTTLQTAVWDIASGEDLSPATLQAIEGF